MQTILIKRKMIHPEQLKTQLSVRQKHIKKFHVDVLCLVVGVGLLFLFSLITVVIEHKMNCNSVCESS